MRWESFRGTRLYLDANVVIYSRERPNRWSALLDELLEAIDDGTVTAVTSELTLAEVLVKPIDVQAADVVAGYERMLSPASPIIVVPVTRDILRITAELRARLRLKPMDAIHVATALAMDCHHVVPEDTRLRLPRELDHPRLVTVEGSTR
ncbi:type II toxin-antitoxin system VapC family toxin [Salinarimonas soli]|uniref:Type II toxin-antitoxin system VapC family toxin n=1 Tax=Salinarimonas soli TaxID=1638099 RepID=A0A5B2VCA2_9HYPH|nr:PIN domain-containing protein [Salinarimonas soli]KAA2236378.1 type II toxin-antitoxin system VapC family toxin [Salinarimonas soli]